MKKILYGGLGVLVLAAVFGGVLARMNSGREDEVVIRAGAVAGAEAPAAAEAQEADVEPAWYELAEEAGEAPAGTEADDEFPEEDPVEESGEDEDWTLEEKAFSAIETSIRKGIRNRNYILENSDVQFLEWNDVRGLSSDEISMACQEIYARHGYRFEKKQVLRYFQAKSWYDAAVSPSDFQAEQVFGEAEKYNVKYLKSLVTVKGLDGMGKAPSKKKVDSYGYENGYSRLSFKLKKGSLTKKNGYYEVTAVYMAPVTVPGDLQPGDEVRVTVNDLKSTKMTLVRDEDGLYDKNDPTRTFEYYNQSGRVTLYEDSADRVDKPVYEGTLLIREDAVEGQWLGKTRTFRPQTLKKKNLRFNAVTFDSKGYAVRLLNVGD